MKTDLLFIHVLIVALLHHLSLPAFLLQGLLDELSHFTLFTRLLSPDNKPAFGQSTVQLRIEKTKCCIQNRFTKAN